MRFIISRRFLLADIKLKP